MQKFCRKNLLTTGSTFSTISTSLFQVKGTLLTHGPILDSFAEVDHIFDSNSVSQFMTLCGDNNPIHHDTEYCQTTIFKKPIVHGILLSSLFSTLFGRTISSSVYISQSLNFKRPVYVGSKLTAKMVVKSIDKKSKGYFLKCNTICYTDSPEVVAIDGEATVLIPLAVYESYIKIGQHIQ
jgi:acyl dehydratase